MYCKRKKLEGLRFGEYVDQSVWQKKLSLANSCRIASMYDIRLICAIGKYSLVKTAQFTKFAKRYIVPPFIHCLQYTLTAN